MHRCLTLSLLSVFGFIASCGGGGSDTGPQTQVPPPPPTNGAPTAFDVNEKTNVNEVLDAMLNAQDPNGDSLTYALTSQPNLGGVSLVDAATGSIRYTPNLDAFGTDQFSYRVNDGVANSMEGVVTIVINRVPVAQPLDVTAATSQPKTATLPGVDDDGDLRTFEIVTQPTSGTLSNLNVSTGEFTYQANAAFEGADSFTWKLNDGFAESTVETVNIAVDAWSGTVNLGAAEEENLIYGVEVDAQRNVYIAYATTGAVAGATSGGGTDTVLAKLDSAGTIVWQVQWGLADDEEPYQLVMGPNNLLYLTVHNRAQGAMGPNYLLRFDLDGSLQWSVNIPDPDIYTLLYRTGVAPNGNAYISLRGAGTGRSGLAKVNNNGTLAFLKHVGSEIENPTDPMHTGPFTAYSIQIRGLAVDANELVYAYYTANYTPQATGVPVTNAMLATFDSNGTIQTRYEPLNYVDFPDPNTHPRMAHIQFTGGGNLRMVGWEGLNTVVSEFDTAANEVWTSRIIADAGIMRLAFRGDVASDGSTVISGAYEPETTTIDDERSVHVTLLDAAGALVWEQIIDATPESGSPLRFDCCGQPKFDVNGDVIYALTSNGTFGMTPNQGGNDVFVMKLDGTSGEIIEAN